MNHHRPLLAAAGLLALIGIMASPVRSAPTYDHKDPGLFGSMGNITFPGGITTVTNFNFNGVGMTLDQTADEYAVRFTAMEDLTVNRAWQRLVSVDAGTEIRVGIMSDSGGNPSGTYLGSAVHTPLIGNSVIDLSFPDVSLVAGNVYHLVTQVVTLPVAQSFQIFASSTSIAIRPYDRALDPMMNYTTRNNGGSWVQNANDPYFWLGDDSGVVGGPGQPYGNVLFNLTTQGGLGGNRLGQRFAITTAEVPEGAVIRVDSIVFATTSGGDDPPLRLSVRLLDGTILGSVVMQPSQSDGVYRRFTLDTPIWLDEGVHYLFTTDFLGPTTTLNTVLLPFHQPQLAGLIAAPATWGGSDFYPVRSTGDAWTSHAPWAGFGHFDLAFGLIGQVFIPEPTTAMLLGLGAAWALKRRTQTTRR